MRFFSAVSFYVIFMFIFIVFLIRSFCFPLFRFSLSQAIQLDGNSFLFASFPSFGNFHNSVYFSCFPFYFLFIYIINIIIILFLKER